MSFFEAEGMWDDDDVDRDRKGRIVVFRDKLLGRKNTVERG